MKKTFTSAIIVVLISAYFNKFYAQKIGFKQLIKQTTWTFGLSNNIVVDGGRETFFPFETKAWNSLPFPNSFFIEGYYYKGWSFNGTISYNQFKSGNIVDKVSITKNGTYVGADFNARFAFSHWAKKEGWFDPYVTFGYGYTYRDNAVNIHTGNNNIGLGCNFWIYKGFGLNLQGLGKWVMKGGTKSNYTQYSVTLVYKLRTKYRNLGDS
jgi:hypothetical protein